MLTLIDNFKEAGRILSTIRLREPIAEMPVIETGQPYAAKPEAEGIAHVAFTVSRAGARLTDGDWQLALQPMRTELGLTGGEPSRPVPTLARGARVTNVRDDVFLGQPIGVKVDGLVHAQAIQVELRSSQSW